MTYYSIDSADGTQICTGIQSVEMVEAVAQEWADTHQEVCWWYEEGEGAAGETHRVTPRAPDTEPAA
jgi:hypothetical protein